MQLQIDPAVDAHRHDLLNVARPRAEGEAIESMHRSLLFVRAGIGCFVFFLGEQLRDRAPIKKARLRDSRNRASLPTLN